MKFVSRRPAVSLIAAAMAPLLYRALGCLCNAAFKAAWRAPIQYGVHCLCRNSAYDLTRTMWTGSLQLNLRHTVCFGMLWQGTHTCQACLVYSGCSSSQLPPSCCSAGRMHHGPSASCWRTAYAFSSCTHRTIAVNTGSYRLCAADSGPSGVQSICLCTCRCAWRIHQ